jgi:hypothetical protein
LPKVGGELLDINYENTYSLNKAELIKEAKVFGFAWMGDGATIHKMPLMNILALNGTTAPMTVFVRPTKVGNQVLTGTRPHHSCILL